MTDLDNRTIAILAGRPAKSVTACARQPRLEKTSCSAAIDDCAKSADVFRVGPDDRHALTAPPPPRPFLCETRKSHLFLTTSERRKQTSAGTSDELDDPGVSLRDHRSAGNGFDKLGIEYGQHQHDDRPNRKLDKCQLTVFKQRSVLVLRVLGCRPDN